jgi:hypothetical protein
MGHNLSVTVLSNHHIGFLARRVPRQSEELAAVEKVRVVE